MALWFFFLLSGGCFKPCPVAKETKTQLFCQKEICAVMSFHNCLRIANHGLSLPLDLCQRTLASIKDGWLFGFFPFFLIFFFLSRLENNGFLLAWTLHVKFLQPMSLSEHTM